MHASGFSLLSTQHELTGYRQLGTGEISIVVSMGSHAPCGGDVCCSSCAILSGLDAAHEGPLAGRWMWQTSDVELRLQELAACSLCLRQTIVLDDRFAEPVSTPWQATSGLTGEPQDALMQADGR